MPKRAAKLTYVQALAVRAMHRRVRARDMAEALGVSVNAINNVQSGLSYRDVVLFASDVPEYEACLRSLSRYIWRRGERRTKQKS